MKHSLLYLFFLLFIGLSAYCGTGDGVGSDAYEKLCKYRFLKDGIGIAVIPGRDSILRSGHDCNAQYVSSIKKYNRGGKRGNTILVTGDLPCFAQMRTYPQITLNPDIFKLGDGRIRITYQSQVFWADSVKDIHTEFYPGITTYRIKIPQIRNVTFDLSVFHARDWGIGAKLEISNTGKNVENIRVDWIYGGLRKCGRTFDAVYFYNDDKSEEGNKPEIRGNSVVLSDTSIIDKIAVTTFPKVVPVRWNNRALFGKDFNVKSSGKQVFFLISSYDKQVENLLTRIEVKDPEKLITENKSYYGKILSKALISTPNQLIDGGFRTALINLDNVFTESAWYEGVQRWSAYFTNLFQLPASISLDQRMQAKNALLFYNSPELGPAPAMRPDKSPEKGTEDDGLDYYIYALLQYVNLTGDTAFLSRIWPDVMKGVKRIMSQKDPDGDNLLYWNFGCNIFLYQADMLGMPGKSSSPSIMTCGMMENLIPYARVLGKEKDAEWLKKTSSAMKTAIMSDLWNRSEGCFYNHIDLQNIAHLSHYYTDHIFSTLYASVDTFINWQSLEYLRKTLIEKDCNGQPSMMRVGSLKGRLFGNDNIMPTQMAEAARAFYQIGDQKQATLFLEAVARAGTVYTEGPGNFPERMNDLGKGEANYLFGNPIGSYIHSVINGLFGLEMINLGQTLKWQPGFPENWDHADLKLSYATVSYKLKTGKLENRATYTARYPADRSLQFSVFLAPCKVLKVLCNGKEIGFDIKPGLNRIELKLKAAPAQSHQLELIYTKGAETDLKEMTVVAGALNKIHLNQTVAGVMDPQSILTGSEINENSAKINVGKRTGKYEFFVKLLNPDFYIPVKLNIVPEYEILCDTSFYSINNKTLIIDSKFRMNQNGKTGHTIESFLSGFNQTQVVDDKTDQSLKFVFRNFPLPTKLNDSVRFRIHDGQGKVTELTKRIIYKGTDEISVESIFKERMNHTRSIDISALFNTHSYLNMFPWGRDELPFTLSLKKMGEKISTRYGHFLYNPAMHTAALIELGRSDGGDRRTVLTQYYKYLDIPVEAQTPEIDLLYFNEVESRNTGTEIGKIVLFYSNNDSTVVPLVVGKNIDFVRSYLARDAFPVFVSENVDKIVSYSANKTYNTCCSKHLNVLPISCNKNKFLKSIQIRIRAADAQFGLIGVNYLTE